MRRLAFPHVGGAGQRLELGFEFLLSEPVGTPTRAALGWPWRPVLRHTRCSPSGLSTSASSHERGPPRWKARPVSHNSVEGSGREFSLEPWEGAGCALRAASTALSAVNLSVSLTVPLTGGGSRVGVLPRGGMYVSVRHHPFPLISQNGFRPVSPHISI